MKTSVKVFNVYDELKNAEVFEDNFSYDDFCEWQASLLSSCVCRTLMSNNLFHVLFVDAEHHQMVEKYVYEHSTGILYRFI